MTKRRNLNAVRVIAFFLLTTAMSPFLVAGFLAGLIWVHLDIGFTAADAWWRRFVDTCTDVG